MRQLRVNLAFLAFALAPLVFDICASLVTGGSFSKALDERNLWVLPFLIFSGTALFVYNWREAEERQKKDPTRNLETTVPAVNRVMHRRALATSSNLPPQADSSDSPVGQPEPSAVGETVQNLINKLWDQSGGEIRPAAYRAAWKLASLMTNIKARSAIGESELTADQLVQPRLRWAVRPEEEDAALSGVLDIINGRIAYLIAQGGIRYLPPPPLMIDPCIAIALIVTKEKKTAYHDKCPARPHLTDVETIKALRLLHRSERVAKDDESVASGKNNLPIEELTYSDLGELIRPELLHTNRELGRKQTELISHLMRHFLTDELSAMLFDALSAEVQASLAVSLLSASQWMRPKSWKYWIMTGHNLPYASKLEAASDLSFATACGLAVGVITLAVWEIVDWISEGWSWYFSSAHLLPTWPGWLKMILAIALIVLCVTGLIRVYPLGIAAGVIACVGVIVSVLASPVVRIHAWISSWGTASTIVICSLICSACLAWLGVFYSDKSYLQKPISFNSVIKEKLSRMPQRSRYRPDHEVGHQSWCISGAQD